jgi:hypothetical protein
MKLQQLHDFKHWHMGHPHGHSVELGLCDMVLAAWVLGWMLLPVMFVLEALPMLPTSLLLTLAPSAYWALRRKLHQRGLLRCDWLHVVAPPTR